MARRAHVYPQVEPGAAALIDTAVMPLPRGASAAAALAAARRRNAVALGLAAGAGVVLREDLARAVDLGVGDLSAETLARPVPVVEGGVSEVAVRRHLAAGAPIVIVRDRDVPVGAVSRGVVPPSPSLAALVSRRLPEPAKALLATVTKVSSARGARAYLVGGVVRDLVLGGPVAPGDVDVVVEGDAPALAEALAAELGGSALVHERFLTASVDVPGLGTVDVVTARSERYETRGALPRVMPAGIRQDLRRRDFAMNAMAIELDSGTFGLLDPFGGRVDVARQRVRVLHPLSFVEDPTRIFRAARYAARLAFTLDAWTARVQALALRLVPYPALSGPRLIAELELILADRQPPGGASILPGGASILPGGASILEVALRRLGVGGAFRLLDPRYRLTRATSARLAGLPAALAWARSRGVDARPVEVAILAIAGDQPADVRTAILRRLGFSGEPLARLGRALEGAPAVTVALAAATARSARARRLRELDGTELAWLWLVGDTVVQASLDWFAEHGRAARPELRGDDLIALGIPRGPAVARALEDLRDARLDGTIGDREAEAAYLRELTTGKEG